MCGPSGKLGLRIDRLAPGALFRRTKSQQRRMKRIILVVGMLCAVPFVCRADDGMIRPLTKHEICTTNWGLDKRHVSVAMKRKVFQRDGYPLGNKDPRCDCEIDHIVPRDLGGADVLQNLQVQSYRGPWNAYQKDRLEIQAHKDVCSGLVSLSEAQGWFLKDWTTAYERRFRRD